MLKYHGENISFLETFLSGMETSPPEMPGLPGKGLETFLSGMETPLPPDEDNAKQNSLETFLSGMETGPKSDYSCDSRQPLKPSLVEWKLSAPPPKAVMGIP